MSQRPQKIHVHDRLKKHAFEHALITTFTFGVRFFEDYALETFRSLQDNGNISVLLDECEYRDLLKAAEANAESFPTLANLRYLLHPVRVPGVFHPKVFLFAGKRRGLLLIGSANFTQDGLSSNAELVAAFDFEEEKNEDALPLFQSALEFFHQLATRWPSEQLRSNIAALEADVPWLSKALKADVGVLPVLLSNLEAPLWEQLAARLPGPVSEVAVLSRFYDAQPSLVECVRASTDNARLTLYTQNGITTLTKAWMDTPEFRSGELVVNMCRYSDGDHPQQLHGKAYAFTCGSSVMLAMGSANFTTSALRRTAASGNLEVLLCYPVAPARQVPPKLLFDPEATAVRLASVGQLETATDNPDEADTAHVDLPIRITEASVEDDWLVIKIAESTTEPAGTCRILQANQRPMLLTVQRIGRCVLKCRLQEVTLKRLRANPALAQLGEQTEDGQWTPQCLPVLTTNIQDLVTGRDLRRERQIREARESPQRFMDVLTVLSSGDDEERLKQFLTYCDIPIDLPARLVRRHSPAPNPNGPIADTLKISGARHLRYFEVLHDAVMDFAHRHHRRLSQHVERGTAKGIPNFLHILLTIGNLLVSQIERLVAALASEEGVELDAERWRQVRDNLDAYYWELGKLIGLTADDYLDALLETGPARTFRSEFVDTLPDLDSILDRADKGRAQLLHLQQDRLVVRTPTGPVAGPGFFSAIVAPSKWPAFAKRLADQRNKLERRLAG